MIPVLDIDDTDYRKNDARTRGGPVQVESTGGGRATGFCNPHFDPCGFFLYSRLEKCLNSGSFKVCSTGVGGGAPAGCPVRLQPDRHAGLEVIVRTMCGRQRGAEAGHEGGDRILKLNAGIWNAAFPSRCYVCSTGRLRL